MRFRGYFFNSYFMQKDLPANKCEKMSLFPIPDACYVKDALQRFKLKQVNKVKTML